MESNKLWCQSVGKLSGDTKVYGKGNVNGDTKVYNKAEVKGDTKGIIPKKENNEY